NHLRSMTIVPITIGQQANEVIDVFYDYEKRLFTEEEDFLRLLAGKAATAIWNTKITRSFKAVSDALLNEQDIEAVLKKITEIAREELYAEPVILFQYDPARKEFILPPIFSDNLHVKKGMYLGIQEKQPDFVTLMIDQPEPLYLVDEEEYREFCQQTNRDWRKDDFWFREKICSLAAIRLQDSRKRPVGVMFINYRAPFKFDPLIRKMIEVFASQASSAIVNARFKKMRNHELLGLSIDKMIA